MYNVEEYNISAYSRLFSSRIIQELAKTGKSPLLMELAQETDLLDKLPSESQVRDIFEYAFRILRLRDNRHEYIYKAVITQRILLGKHSLRTASMINEFRVDDCKADVAIFNGTATVYEIKSERDSLSRLQNQIDAYRKFFASVYVIAGANHIDSILSSVPDDVGVLCLNSDYGIKNIREATDSPARTESLVIYDSLRTQEAKNILSRLNISIPEVPNTEMHSAMRDIFRTLPSAEVHLAMVEVIKKSRDLLPLSELVEGLPDSLHSVVLSTKIRKCDRNKLIGALNTNIYYAQEWIN